MSKIVKDINWSLFIGSKEEQKRVKDFLTFEDDSVKYTKAYKRFGYVKKKKLYMIVKRGILFRSGIVDEVAQVVNAEIEIVKNDIVVKDANLEGLRHYQIEAVEAVKKNRCGYILVPTSGGKTWIGAGVAYSFECKKLLYVIHRRELLRQVYDDFVKFFGKENVGRFGGGYNEWNKKYVICMIQSLNAKMKKDKIDLDSVDGLIFDESHHCKSASYVRLIDNCINLKVKIGMTGSLPSGKKVWFEYKSILGDVLYEIDHKILVDEGFIVAPYVSMYKVNWKEYSEGIRNSINWGAFGAEGKYWAKVRKEVLVNNETRNGIVVDLVSGKKGVLVIVDLIAHGRLLGEMIGCDFVWAGSEERKELFDKFKNNEIDILVTSPILEEGIDISGIRTVVLASGGKSKIKLLQRIGRGMRLSKGKEQVDVIDFYDTGIPLLERHAEERKKVYDKQGYKVKIIG